MPESTPFAPTVTTILALTRTRGRARVRELQSFAQRLDARAQHADWRGEQHEAARLRDLAYVHRAAAQEAARQASAGGLRAWWRGRNLWP